MFDIPVACLCLGSTIRSGAAFWPMFTKFYYDRVAAYRDGLQQFVLAFRSAYAEEIKREAQQMTNKDKDAPKTSDTNGP